MSFLPAERLIISVLATLASLDFCLILWKGVEIDLLGYAGLTCCGLFAIALGQFYRSWRPDAGIAATATAAGLFVLFTLTASVFNYLLLPLRTPTIDRFLVGIDALLGYSWPGIVGWAAEWPLIGTGLHFVYMSSLPQLLIALIALGFSGRTRTLHHFLLTGIIGASLAIITWSLMPSFGPSALFSLPSSVMHKISLAVDSSYGEKMLTLGLEGPGYITPENILGLIAFPSFHTVMACMSVCFLARLKFLAIPALFLNLAMLPAILIHGGHHLVDLFGGVVTFGVAYGLAGHALREIDRDQMKRKAAAAAAPVV